ncbi:type VI secretion system-associated FHA domain protein, partial [Sphingomonas bacterium]|uniref:type VI secretion system-associated FHA domain protein n=1 Tax=Sphingomonas bacterium TaxID=1895847 RepID=UPI0015756113
MTLTLRIRGLDRLDNGMPAEFVLNRRGAVIGRAATCDWSLPDPRHYISSRHLDVGYRDGAYTITDVSTNGTFLNGAGERMAEPRRVEPGDLFTVGQYDIAAELTGEAAAAIERREERQTEQANKEASWSWDQHGGSTGPGQSAAPDDGGGWGAAANDEASSGFAGEAAPLGGGW